LWDPSVLGRWEYTPASVPVLSRIASIEGPEDEWVEYTDPTPADLIPEVSEYRIGPGDRLNIILYDLPEEGRQTPYEGKLVDTRGYIELPQLGAINVNGLTVGEAVQAIENAMRSLVNQPLATVDVLQPRSQRFSVLGAVQAPGSYIIPVADYRLLEALTAAGGFSEAPDSVYIIRQTPLTEAAGGRTTRARQPAPGEAPPPPSGERLNDIIRDLTTPGPTGGTGPQNPPPGAGPALPPPAPQPPAPRPPAQEPPGPAPTGSTGQTGSTGTTGGTGGTGAPPIDLLPRPGGSPGVFQPAGQPSGQPATPPSPPPIDLIERGRAAPTPAAEDGQQPEPDNGETTWAYFNGKWVKIKKPGAAGAQPPMPGPLAAANASALVTQRVIRVPLDRLKSGDARVNIVVRPGDIIRLPPPPAGVFYMTGQVARPGVFSLTDKLTLTNAIVSAGGLGQTAVPERVDISRFVGRDRVATIRVDLRAIQERTEPDIFLKANDQVNVGSNFLATPLAVIRNGFRFTYGFGFLADRNFGSDLFGVPPEAEARNGF
jgi:protein involved in polysaccharide export with SLBB domain